METDLGDDMTIRLLAISASLLLFSSQALSEQTKVLGLPLGGVFEKMPAKCPQNSFEHKQLCWIEGPKKSKDGSSYGLFHIPHDFPIPSWASFSLIHVTLDKNNAVSMITARTLESTKRQEVIDSIKTRFGAPDSFVSTPSGAIGVTWVARDVYVSLTCGDACTAEFWTPEARLEHNRRVEAYRQKEAMRPAAP